MYEFKPLSDAVLRDATHFLIQKDKELAYVFEKYGYSPLWDREPSFSTLVHLILEQQVSLASANAAFQKLKEKIGQVSPENFLQLDDDELKKIGFSRQKTNYARSLAQKIQSGEFDLEKLHHFDDDEVKTEMKKLKGIGDWTADVFLSECLLRPDILPKGDIAMLEAVRVLKKLDSRPTHDVFEKLTEHWRPFRSVGTRMLWHFYLCERRKK